MSGFLVTVTDEDGDMIASASADTLGDAFTLAADIAADNVTEAAADDAETRIASARGAAIARVAPALATYVGGGPLVDPRTTFVDLMADVLLNARALGLDAEELIGWARTHAEADELEGVTPRRATVEEFCAFCGDVMELGDEVIDVDVTEDNRLDLPGATGGWATIHARHRLSRRRRDRQRPEFTGCALHGDTFVGLCEACRVVNEIDEELGG